MCGGGGDCDWFVSYSPLNWKMISKWILRFCEWEYMHVVLVSHVYFLGQISTKYVNIKLIDAHCTGTQPVSKRIHFTFNCAQHPYSEAFNNFLCLCIKRRLSGLYNILYSLPLFFSLTPPPPLLVSLPFSLSPSPLTVSTQSTYLGEIGTNAFVHFLLFFFSSPLN